MSSVLGCYHGAFALGLRWFEMRRLPAVWLAPALWVTLEWLRGWFFIGFPWAALGYSQYRFHSLVQMVEVTGVYGVSAVLVLFNVVVAAVLLAHGSGARRNLPALATLTLLVVLLVGVGRWRAAALDALPAAGHAARRAGAGQRRAGPEVGSRRSRTRPWSATVELTVEAARERPGLIVWPETAAPFFFQEPGPQRDEVLALARQTGTPLALRQPGLPPAPERQARAAEPRLPGARRRPRGRYLRQDGAGAVRRVRARSSRSSSSCRRWSPRSATSEPGIVPTVFALPGARFGTLICYEGIFPALTRRFVAGGANFLVNVTNDAWFGQTSAPYQHLAQDTFRADREPRADGPRREHGDQRHRRRRRAISAGRARCSRCCGTWTRSTGPGCARFYTRFGDVFVWACALATAVAIAYGLTRRTRA